jgi:hypothetical protein
MVTVKHRHSHLTLSPACRIGSKRNHAQRMALHVLFLYEVISRANGGYNCRSHKRGTMARLFLGGYGATFMYLPGNRELLSSGISSCDK